MLGVHGDIYFRKQRTFYKVTRISAVRIIPVLESKILGQILSRESVLVSAGDDFFCERTAKRLNTSLLLTTDLP